MCHLYSIKNVFLFISIQRKREQTVHSFWRMGAAGINQSWRNVIAGGVSGFIIVIIIVITSAKEVIVPQSLVEAGRQKNQLNIGADPSQGADQGQFFLFLFPYSLFQRMLLSVAFQSNMWLFCWLFLHFGKVKEGRSYWNQSLITCTTSMLSELNHTQPWSMWLNTDAHGA